MLNGTPPTTVRPAHLGLVVVGGVLAFAGASGVDDIDAYWHVELGREILREHTLDPQGRSWLGATGGPWHTTQWLSEAVMAGLVDAGGWEALAAARAVAVVALVVTLVATLLPRRAPAVALVLLAVVGTGLVPHAQVRPQTVSLFFVLGLTAVCRRAWSEHRPPPAPLVAVGAVVWAQFHGLWILAPAALALTCAGLAIDARRRLTPAAVVRGTALAALASLAGMLNPRGPGSFTAPLGFTGAGTVLEEWRTTALDESASLSFALVLALVVAGWLRRPRPLPAAELLWVGAFAAFAFLAYRNALVALLALAPVAATGLQQAQPHGAPWATQVGRREGQVLAGLSIVAAVAAAVAVTVRVVTGPALPDAPVRPIAEALAAHPAPVRVFNAYNASGELIAFSGGTVRLAVDGRFDLWGEQYVRRIVDAEFLGAGWQDTVRSFAPDAMVLPERVPLTTLLEREGSWQVTRRSGGWVLLLPSPR